MKKIAVGVGAALVAGSFLLHSPAPTPTLAPPPFSTDRLLKRMLKDGKAKGSIDTAYVEQIAKEMNIPPPRAMLEVLYCKDVLNRYVR